MNFKALGGDFFGAFADTGILVPILALLTLKGGYRMDALLFSAGAAYLISGWWFQSPISVQPLKSIAIASISMGATFEEIRFSGILVGLFFLILYFLKLKRIPWSSSLVASVQFGLGVLLMKQAVSSTPMTLLGMSILFMGTAIILFADRHFRYPLLGALAFGAFLSGMKLLDHSVTSGTPAISLGFQHFSELRVPLITALVLPQLALTSANSISGAQVAIERYFPEKGKSISLSKFLLSIGLGNLISGAMSGLPYCHGAGGITAHYRGGARTKLMNAIIGGLLLVLAIFIHFFPISFSMNPMALGILLLSVGIFHLDLARTHLPGRSGIILMIVSALLAGFTGNLLYVLLAAFTFELRKHAI